LKKKINIIVPLAGKGQRFVDAGYNVPKALMLAKGKHFIDWSMDSINYNDCNLIFVVRNEHIYSFAIDKILKEKYGDDITIVNAVEDTRGSVESCLLAKEYINNDNPLIVYCIDVHFGDVFCPYEDVDENLDGLLLTFKSNSPNYSYSEVDENGNVIKVAEKTVISNNANVGLYYFKKGNDFVSCSEEMISKNITSKGEFYIAPVYNLLIEKGKNIGISEVNKMFVMGTPRELDFFENTALNILDENSKIALCCDHSGFELKEQCKKYLKNNKIDYIDFGTLTYIDCDQVDFTKMACKSIQNKECTHGFGFCRTGQAINIAANKHKKIKSALVFDEYTARYSIQHNAVNFFSFPTKYVNGELFTKIMWTLFNNSEFEGGRHQVRVQKIEDIEND
jgi:RpiB/LacA/LacB family sugar-phosphate isomerase